jgi:hypothetical protein
MDPMLSDNFLLTIPSIPLAAGTKGGDSSGKSLALQCRTVSKPGVTLENVEVALFGHTLQYVGRKTFSHDMTVEFVENRNGVIQQTLEGWAEFCRATQTQLGNYKGGSTTQAAGGYARTGILDVYDVTGLLKMQYQIVNLWPSSVPEVAFDGSSATLITLSVTFKYDYYVQLQ